MEIEVFTYLLDVQSHGIKHPAPPPPSWVHAFPTASPLHCTGVRVDAAVLAPRPRPTTAVHRHHPHVRAVAQQLQHQQAQAAP